MFIVQMGEMHFLVDRGQDYLDIAWLPAFFYTSSELWKGLIAGPDVEGVCGPAIPTGAA
jgi:hypothetical protein